jgi:hypothetical protein
MVGSASQGNLAQRTGLALAQALRHNHGGDPLGVDGRLKRGTDLLIDGVERERLPGSFDRGRLRSPDSPTALAFNTFLPWRQAIDQLPLCGIDGFDAIQFEVRCPTGLRGTPPHLDLLALKDRAVVAATVRCCDYLVRRKSPVADSYDRLLEDTPGAGPWARELARLRAAPDVYRHVDVGALIKHALALGRTFPDRRSTLLYLFWEPLDAAQFEEFRRHRAELEGLSKALAGARIAFVSQTFDSLWQEWATRAAPAWLAEHVARLRARYDVAIGTAGRL